MMAAQFNIDVVSQLKDLLPAFKLIVPTFVIQELENIQKRSQGKTKAAASVALKITASDSVHIKPVPLIENERVDDALIRISQVLCTNDRDLRQKAREKGINVVYLRQRKYLAVDGYLNP
jgi:uncharacterized protein